MRQRRRMMSHLAGSFTLLEWLRAGRAFPLNALRVRIACACALVTGQAALAEEVVQPLRLGELEVCGVLQGDMVPALVVLHSEYLDRWYDHTARNLQEGLARWKRATNPSARLASVGAAKNAVSSLRSAFEGAADADRILVDDAVVLLDSELCIAELRLAAIGREIAVWNVPDISGMRIGDPADPVRVAALPWCVTADERAAVVTAMQSWPRSMKDRAESIMTLPVDLAQGAAAIGVSSSTDLTTLGESQRDQLAEVGVRVMRSSAEAAVNWWQKRVDQSFRDGDSVAGGPVRARVVKLAACRVSGDQELRALAGRELAVLAALGSLASDEVVAAKVTQSCVRLASAEARLRDAMRAAPPRREQLEAEQRGAQRTEWMTEWQQQIEVLESLARELGARQGDRARRPGALVLEEWGRALGSLGSPAGRRLAMTSDWSDWAAPIVAAAGIQPSRWESVASGIEERTPSFATADKHVEELVRAMSTDQCDSAPVDIADVDRAAAALPAELLADAVRCAESLRLACVEVGIAPSEAGHVASAWTRDALMKVRVIVSNPPDLFAAAECDLWIFAMQSSRPLSAIVSDPTMVGYASTRQGLIQEHVRATAEFAALIALDASARREGRMLEPQVEHAIELAWKRDDESLRRLVRLNEETARSLDSATEGGWEPITTAYRRRVASAPAAVSAFVATLGPDVAEDPEVMRQLEILRVARVQRLVSTDPAAGRKFDDQSAQALSRIAQLLDNLAAR